ncbi:MAG: TIGR04282 family arsenosugar biosynthesis glycosyltransferase, partial [Verrucomicrobia bacterium]|nr:TIGR04282 family arsenosugar biosynthesis glycosyltransferase [Verrucomicrobiota bacterium]
MPDRIQIIVFSRYPQPGETKTRMIPALGPEGACNLQRAMSGHTLLTARVAAQATAAHLSVRYTGGSAKQLQRWLGNGTDYRPQGDGDLGDRMREAMATSFAEGSQATVIIGTDCPSLTPALLAEALHALRDHDVVFGPAADGGYYLIGLRRLIPGLFTGIQWGGETVLRQSLAAIDDQALAIKWLPPLNDVDRADDLPVWESVRPPPLGDPTEAAISVVIPALNEAATLGRTVAHIRRHVQEVIVVDGGSTDDTATIAHDAGARVRSAPAGRAAQMNVGALAATSPLLVFLHADTQLPDGFTGAIRRAAAQPGFAAGAFSFRIDGQGAGLRLIEAFTNFRSRYLQLPYGDQALFVAKARFHELGGYGHLPIMED